MAKKIGVGSHKTTRNKDNSITIKVRTDKGTWKKVQRVKAPSKGK
jgi:hypothetical protein